MTGGTGDIKPQYFTVETGVAGAINDYVVNTFVLPVPRFGTMKTKATVFEVLSVDWYLGMEDINDTGGQHWAFLTTNTNRVDGETSTVGSLNTDLTDPRTFALATILKAITTSGGMAWSFPIQIDTTDGNGNGILIATDRITLVGGAIGNTTGANYICKIKYRMVNIGISEYVGIVQSQQ